MTNSNFITYQQKVEKRVLSGSNPIVKSLLDEYKSQITVSDPSYKGTAHYNPYSHVIKLNCNADIQNPTGACSTYFHEVGHMIDDFAGNGHSWLSSNPDFRLALENDVKSYINNVVLNFGCSIDEAYAIICSQLEGDNLAGVSDIFGSLTECRCQGDWGHSTTYWQCGEDKVEKEAFANMFEASIGSTDKLQAMKLFFPTAYVKFEKIIKDRY